MEEISYAETDRGWQVTFNGQVPGDSPAYDTAEQARAAALKFMAKYNRCGIYTFVEPD